MREKDNIKQFKMNNGNEVICEIIEWMSDDFKEVVVKNCMEIIKIQNTHETYYVFRPWMHYIESNDDLMVLNSSHVIATANPNPGLLMQYFWAVKDAHLAAEERELAYRSETMHRLSEAAKQMEKLLAKRAGKDSAEPNNIIPFPIF